MTVAERGAILITGAAGGIGSAVSRALHEVGWNLSLLDLDGDRVAALADKLNSERPDSCECRAGSGADEAVVRGWVDQARVRFGGISGLVNVAGWFKPQSFETLRVDEIEAMISANLMTAAICCRVACEPMLADGAGSIVNFASTAGEYGSISPAAHYAAAKGGVIALTKSLARELSPRGIRVNAVSPGPVDTLALGDGKFTPQGEAASRTLLGRLGTPAEIAACVEFLISDRSSYVTGHVLRANGGSLL